MSDPNVLCDASTLEDQKPVAAKSPDGRDLVVVSVKGSIAVLDGICPHRGAPLAEGWVSDGCLVCPWHGWGFNLKTGMHAPNVGVECHRAEVRDGKVRLR